MLTSGLSRRMRPAPRGRLIGQIPTATSTRCATSRSRAACTPATGITSRGAAVHGIEALKDGLVGRGVLLDIPGCGMCPGSSPASTCSARSSWRQSPETWRVVVDEVHQVHGLFRVVGQDAGQRLASHPVQQQQRHWQTADRQIGRTPPPAIWFPCLPNMNVTADAVGLVQPPTLRSRTGG